MRVLVLGGTFEARMLAGRLVEAGHEVTSSLAGRTSAPSRPAGELHVGGFGGAAGLAQYLQAHAFDTLVDATHPYAARISHQAVEAAQICGVKLIRLMRPAWRAPLNANWIDVESAEAALAQVPIDAMPFFSLGHKDLPALHAWRGARALVRLIDPPQDPLPVHVTLVLDRPPHGRDAEINLMRIHGVTHLISKNSGGTQTFGKIEAAALLGLPILIVRRPVLPEAVEVDSVHAAFDLLHDPAS